MKDDEADEPIYLAGLGPLKGLLRKGPVPLDYPKELGAAKATLKTSDEIAQQICSGVKSDLAYWFARLYYYITLYEIADRKAFTYPAFVMHFIPVFYDLYATPARQFIASNKNPSKPAQGSSPDPARITEWSGHFGLCRMETTIATPTHWLAHVVLAISTGVSVHIQSDMKTALVTAYRSFSSKYVGVPSFASLWPDFFDNNKPIFAKVRTVLLNELIGRCMRISVDPNFASAATQKFNMGLDIPTIYAWRQTAWDAAKEELARKPGR